MLLSNDWFQLWLPGLDVNTGWKLGVTCCGLAMLSALHEAISAARMRITADATSPRWHNRQHWLRVLLHFLQVTIGYLLMLAVMTCSPWVLASACVGATLGYAAFAPLGHGQAGGNPRAAADRKATEAGHATYRRLDEER